MRDMHRFTTWGERFHRVASKRWRGVAVGILSAGMGALAGCPGDADLCDPKNYPDGCLSVSPSLCCTCPGDACFDAGAGGGSNGDAGDPGDASADGPIENCPGQCLFYPPSGWDKPSLLWMGPETEAPPCPTDAPDLTDTGYIDLDASNGCTACACAPPTGACTLPAALTASSTTCSGADAGANHTPFDPPAGWDGHCTANDAILAGALCSGPPSGPCVRSLTIAPPTLDEEGCTPGTATPIPSPPSWKTVARECRGAPFGDCGSDGLLCAPLSAPGFLVCVFHDGDQDCPGPGLGPYQERHIVYKSYDDTRSCSPCTCDPPAGSTCTEQLSLYADGECGTNPSYVLTIDSSGPACFDLVPGAALGSKLAGQPTYIGGACAPSGGSPQGGVSPTDAVTFCCIPSL